jgi:hypothetical protein
VKAGVFDNCSLDDYAHTATSSNDVSCFIAKASMQIFYSVPPATQAVPVYLVSSGHANNGMHTCSRCLLLLCARA